YMAWLLVAPGKGGGGAGGLARPFGFLRAVLFQWANPKAWLICAGMIASYTDPARLAHSTAWVSLVFLLVSAPLLVAWTVGGELLQGWLGDSRRLLRFNRCMAALLAISVVGIVA